MLDLEIFMLYQQISSIKGKDRTAVMKDTTFDGFLRQTELPDRQCSASDL